MKEKSLKKNFAYNFLYQLLAIIVPLITSPYLARTLGAENIGIASWTNSIVFYFGMFIVLGVENYGNREIAYVRASRVECSKKVLEHLCLSADKFHYSSHALFLLCQCNSKRI